MNRRKKFRIPAPLLYVASGAILGYILPSCQTQDVVYERSGQRYITFDHKEYPVFEDQVGSIEHRIRGLLLTSPREVRSAIDKVLSEVD